MRLDELEARRLQVLCIEDDPATAEELSGPLREAGHGVTLAGTAEQGLAAIARSTFDVITLDRMLPDGDGVAILTRIRASGDRTPVLMISALSDIDDRIRGLRAGGDDYLGKPFASAEMVVRVEVLGRRVRETQAVALEGGGLRLNLVTHEVTVGAAAALLKPTESRLLEFLMRHPDAVLGRALIFEKVFGYRFDPGSNLIDVHVGRLRRKIEALEIVAPIETVRGEGFRFRG